MGAMMAIPLLPSLGGILASAASGLAFCCTAQAASALCKSCNCNSSVATRVGYSLIFLLNSLVAWVMLTDWAIKLIQKYTYDYLKLTCTEGKCYGVLAVHRICFALGLLHVILSALLVGVHSTKSKRAAIQNGWWGPKVAAWLVLIGVSFTIPNGFFIFYSNYISLIGATVFILIGLVLLIDFAHSWSETCLEKWEETDSPFWKWTLIGSTLSLYVVTLALIIVQYVFFAKSGCTTNITLITLNLLFTIVVTVLSISPAIQEANPRSGLAQSGMVVAYTAYLVTSAIANHDDNSETCNPLQSRARGARSGMVVLGAVFTFLAIAYSTSRAATQSKALVGRKGSAAPGAIRLEEEEVAQGGGELSTVTTQPGKKDTLRYQALVAAVAAGSIPASALDEPDSDDEDEGTANVKDDERTGTRYNYSWFHIIFLLATMYTAMLLTNWNVIATDGPNMPIPGADDGSPVRIGRSHVSMWMRIVSSWVCLALYAWSLLAPVLLPDRFGD